jgi:hypothetical protein
MCAVLVRLASDTRAWKAFCSIQFLALLAEHGNIKGQYEVISQLNLFVKGEYSMSNCTSVLANWN